MRQLSRRAPVSLGFALVCVVGSTGRAHAQQATTTHIVVKGENLSVIARQNGVSLKALEKANPQILDFNKIFPGDRIVIPGAPLAANACAAVFLAEVASWFPQSPAAPASALAQSFALPQQGTASFAQSTSFQTTPAQTTPFQTTPTQPPAQAVPQTTAPQATAPQTTAPQTTAPQAPTQATAPPSAAPTTAQTACPTQGVDDATFKKLQDAALADPTNPNTGTQDWHKWCLALARTIYENATGKKIPELDGKGTAYNAFLAFKKEGLIHDDGSAPPRGALVFWSPAERARMAPTSAGATAGHVAISNGDGTVISNVKRGSKYAIEEGASLSVRIPIERFGTPCGWALPKK